MNDFFKDKCEVVRDLLPIYADHGTSPKTTALIAQHIAKCDCCSKYLIYIKKCKETQRSKIKAEVSPDYSRFLKALKKKRMEHAVITTLFTVSLSAILASAILRAKDINTK